MVNLSGGKGKVDRDLKALTKYAIKRELTPDVINEFRSDYRETRRGYLEKMLQALNKM